MNKQGHSLVDIRITHSIRKLWEGHLHPRDLDKIEIGLRALIVSKTLTLSRVESPWVSGEHATRTDYYRGIQNPFDDHLLDYEFEDPFSNIPQANIPLDEQNYLEEYIENKLDDAAHATIPKWVRLQGEYLAFLDAWYAGYPLDECEARGKLMLGWEDHVKKHEPFDTNHPVFHKGPRGDAKYLIGAYRAGLDIYSTAPISKLCQQFIFSEWPRKLFASFEEEYKNIVRQLRGPACAIDLPPITTLVLSRAENRNTIQETIRDLREEYKQDREKLWSYLSSIWEAETIKEQLELFSILSDASNNIFKAAFPERMDVLSLGLDLAQLSPGGITSGLKQIRKHDLPNSKVQAISFAHRLSKDFRKNLLSSKKALKRHLTLSEYNNFGLN